MASIQWGQGNFLEQVALELGLAEGTPGGKQHE